LVEKVHMLEENFSLDNLVFTKQQEELDAIANEKADDRFA